MPPNTIQLCTDWFKSALKSPHYSTWTLTIKDPKIKKAFYERKTRMTRYAMFFLAIVNIVLNMALVQNVLQTKRYLLLTQLGSWIPLILTILLSHRFPNMLFYTPALFIFLRQALSLYARRLTLADEMNLESSGIYLDLVFYTLNCIVYVLFLSIKFVGSSLFMAFLMIFSYIGWAAGVKQHLTVEQSQEIDAWLYFSVLVTIFTVQGIFYVTFRSELELVIRNEITQRERSQLKQILNMIPDAVIIASKLDDQSEDQNDQTSRPLGAQPDKREHFIRFCNHSAAKLTKQPSLDEQVPDVLKQNTILDEKFLDLQTKGNRRASMLPKTSISQIMRNYVSPDQNLQFEPKPQLTNLQTINTDNDVYRITAGGSGSGAQDESSVKERLIKIQQRDVLFDEETCRLVFIRDMTQQAQLQEKKATLLAHEKMTGTISHEMRTPLNVIMQLGEILQKRENDPKKLKLINMILVSGKNLLATVNDFLDFALMRENKFKLNVERMNVEDTMNEVIKLFRLQAGSKRIKLKLKIEKFVPEEINADKRRVQQILRNYLANALKFTSKGDICVLVRYNIKGFKLQVAVKDTGIGIKKQHLPLLFKHFGVIQSSRSRHNPNGVGFGLAIVREMCHKMNGNVGVDSKFGKGSTFWFEIQTQLPFHEKSVLERIQEVDRETIETEFKAEEGHDSYTVSGDFGRKSIQIVQDSQTRGLQNVKTPSMGALPQNTDQQQVEENKETYKSNEVKLDDIKNSDSFELSMQEVEITDLNDLMQPKAVPTENNTISQTSRPKRAIYMIDDELFNTVIMKQMIIDFDECSYKESDFAIYYDPVFAITEMKARIENLAKEPLAEKILFFVDRNMPGMLGDEFASQVREMFAKLENTEHAVDANMVLYSSQRANGFADKMNLLKNSLGVQVFDNYMQKPASMEDLMTMLETYNFDK